MKIIAENKKAYYNYQILKKFEAGISLLGQEVKAIKKRGLNLAGTYVVLKGVTKSGLPEVFWVGATIAPYQPKNASKDYNKERNRKLLLKKSEIKYLVGKWRQRGLTFVPLRLYTLKKGKIKLEFAVSKGRKKFNKKDLIKKREVERMLQRELKKRG